MRHDERGHSDVGRANSNKDLWPFSCKPCDRKFGSARANDYTQHLIRRHNVWCSSTRSGKTYHADDELERDGPFRAATEQEIVDVTGRRRVWSAQWRERNREAHPSRRGRGRPPSRGGRSGGAGSEVRGREDAMRHRRSEDREGRVPERKKARRGNDATTCPSPGARGGREAFQCRAAKTQPGREYDLHSGWKPTVQLERLKSIAPTDRWRRRWQDTGFLKLPTYQERLRDRARLRSSIRGHTRAPSRLDVSDSDDDGARRTRDHERSTADDNRSKGRHDPFYRIPRRDSGSADGAGRARNVLPDAKADKRGEAAAEWEMWTADQNRRSYQLAAERQNSGSRIKSCPQERSRDRSRHRGSLDETRHDAKKRTLSPTDRVRRRREPS